MLQYGLATYHHPDQQHATALVINDQYYDLHDIFRILNPEQAAAPNCIQNIDQMIAHWQAVSESIDALAGDAQALITSGEIAPLTDISTHLLAPLTPNRIFGAASNFVEHAAEMETALAAKADSSPYMFMKATTSVIGPNETVLIPAETEKPDWEVELGVVIGRAGRRIKAQNAADYIAGYTIVNDVSARDMNRRSDFPFKHDWFRGKSWDTFCPLGPWFVPRSAIADPHQLGMGLSVNGEVMQDGNSAEMIFDAYEQIAYLSSLLTLQPGDVIATGTPAGVGMGRGIFLQPGDVMEAWIEGLGRLRNPVAAEADLADQD